VNRWEEFQSPPQAKRGKAWVPPWIKLYPRLLDDPAFIALSPETRCLLVSLWMLFGRCRGTITKDTRSLSRQLHQRVTERQLDSLNHAGFIGFCSGTVLERRRNAFWNRSNPEVEVEKKEPKAVTARTDPARENGRTERPPDFKIPENLTKEMPL
jgi:hypothetical protein